MHKVILLLIGFLAAAYAQCSGNGVLVGSDCACYSGNSGSDCSSFDAGSCSFQTALPLNTTIVAEFANGAVLNDFFTFSVLSEAYNQRYFDDISLAGNSSCSYPGSSFFTHSFLGLPDCMDSYNANFSIPDVVGCGFTTDAISVPGQFLIQGSIHVSAIDSLGQFRSAQLNRNTRSVLNVEITIPTSVFVNTTTPLTVFSTINPTYAITSQEYDATTDTMTIVLTSSVQWPYQLVSPVISGAVLPDSSSISDNSNGCSQFSGNCFQDTTLTWSPVANRGPCDISGAYTFTWNFDCRSGQSPCPVDGSGTETATAQIQASDVCAKVTVVANIGGSLHSYPDNTFNTPQLVFVAGQTLYFLASLTSDVSINVISMDILTVTQQNQSPQTLVSSGIPNDGQYIGLNYGTDPTGNPDEFGFHFDAFAGPSSEFIFDTSVPDSVFTFTVEATFNIQYKTTFGRKRDTVTESLTFTHRGVLDTSMKANNVHAGLNSDGTNSGYKVAATVVPFAFAAAGVVANNL